MEQGVATTEIEPGTYRIISGIAGTAIQVLDQNPFDVVAWELHGGDNQQWFVQRSGDGYTFKNRRHGLYLATRSSEEHSRLYGSKYPMTWVLRKINDRYSVQFPNTTRALDLHCGLATNGNRIHLFVFEAPSHGDFKTWRFQRLSNETGEARENVLQEEIVRLRRQVADKERQLSEQCALTSQLEGSVRQLQEIIRARDEVFASAYRSNEEVTHLREQQTQLQNEVAGLRATMDRFEDFMSQTIDNSSRSRHNAT